MKALSTIYKLFILIFSVIVTTSCVNQVKRMNSLINELPVEERSYMLGRFAVECTPLEGGECDQTFNAISIFYGDQQFANFFDRLQSVNGSIFGNNSSYDFIDLKRNEKGFYYCKPLLAGKYSFFDVRYTNFAGGGTGYRLDEETYLNLPFTLNSGELAYVGNIKITTSQSENMFGMDLTVPGFVELSKESPSDIQKALKKCPDEAKGKVIKNISLKSSDAKAHPLIIDSRK